VARLTILPLRANDAGTRSSSCEGVPASKKECVSNRKKKNQSVGNTRSLTSRIHCTLDARMCWTCSFLRPRTSDKHCKRELSTSLIEVSTVECDFCVPVASSRNPRSLLPPKRRKNNLCLGQASGAASSSPTRRPKCKQKIAKFSANNRCTTA